jgi:hypothetical protein
MGLFSKKPKIRFETITVEREREVFRALEGRGWILCDEPFQFDVKKPPEKLRKDAKSVAKDLNGELIVEIYDPIYQSMPWKGLRYAVWRKATQDEMVERIKKQQEKARPNYKDTMGSYEDIQKKLDQKKIVVTEEDLHALDSVVSTQNIDVKGDLDGKTKEELREASEAIQAISTFNPYDHQGEEGHEMDGELGPSGPVFQESIQLQSDMPEDRELPSDIDAMSMMQEAASEPPVEVKEPELPIKSEGSSPPANVPEGGSPMNIQPAKSPVASDPPTPPVRSPPPSPPAFSPPPGPPGLNEKKDEENGGQ